MLILFHFIICIKSLVPHIGAYTFVEEICNIISRPHHLHYRDDDDKDGNGYDADVDDDGDPPHH